MIVTCIDPSSIAPALVAGPLAERALRSTRAGLGLAPLAPAAADALRVADALSRAGTFSVA